MTVLQFRAWVSRQRDLVLCVPEWVSWGGVLCYKVTLCRRKSPYHEVSAYGPTGSAARRSLARFVTRIRDAK